MASCSFGDFGGLSQLSQDTRDEYARRFLEHHAVAEVTAKGHKAALNVLKGTSAGECPIGELTPELLVDLENEARAQGKKGSTLAKRRAFYAKISVPPTPCRAGGFATRASRRRAGPT